MASSASGKDTAAADSTENGAPECTALPPLPPVPTPELRTAAECEQFVAALPGGPAALAEAAARAEVFKQALADGSTQACESAQQLQGIVAELCQDIQAACPQLTDGVPLRILSASCWRAI